ncbi:unnamed protein product [Trypanosoma congolense IL3000]|uniref:WGS project CAEQ00000000 data, annotated contig 1150 n=1 Tax=Trypanosoma congolense (strain IL3000) TaxID=1068625 RepID=F9W464_TRYCI|nr:unnamed protein product [Trypanosoma congolense IL3000]
MSVQRSNEASDRLTHQVASTPSTQRQPGGTGDSEMREVVWKVFKSFKGACLVDFLTQECGKTHGACNPNAAPAAFMEDPSHYIEEDERRKEAVEKLPEKLHHLKGCIFRDVPFLRAVGITTGGGLGSSSFLPRNAYSNHQLHSFTCMWLSSPRRN